jgi:hypothetical protein
VSLNPDALNASGRFKVYTLDGSTDVDLQADGESSCRCIQLLSTATGNLTLVQTSPKTGATNPAIPVDNLPAGTPLNVQASKIVGGVPSGLKLLVLWCFALCLAGCTAAQGRTVAAGLDALCQGGLIVEGDPGAVPLCVAPELVEKWIEALNPPTTGRRAPQTPAMRYAAAQAVGAKPIEVSK